MSYHTIAVRVVPTCLKHLMEVAIVGSTSRPIEKHREYRHAKVIRQVAAAMRSVAVSTATTC